MAPVSFDWEPNGHFLSRKAENTPLILYRNHRQAIGTTLEVFLGYNQDDDPERIFEVEEMNTIFSEDFIDKLRESKADTIPSRWVAWLDDRDLECNPRLNCGRMSISMLYNTLKKEVSLHLLSKPSLYTDSTDSHPALCV